MLAAFKSKFKTYLSRTFICNYMQNHQPFDADLTILTHSGRMTCICVGKPAIIGSDNGLSPGRRQAII